MPSSVEWLNKRGCEYLATITALEPTFLGELQISEKDLPQLFLRVRQIFDPDQSDAIRACVAVAAVHAAVHASEHHSSYIELFFERLGAAVDQATWNRSYGPSILRFLRDHFDETDRPGGFRYVRPILNQAGISYRAMPAFAKFVGKLRELFGMSFTRMEYETCLRSVTSSFARRFLVEGPGFDFTRDVVRTLERIETGLIPREAIDTIPGYRHCFWTELLAHLELRSGSDDRRPNRFPIPAEFLDTENDRLVLRFDEQGIARRAYLMNGRTVNFAVEAITNYQPLSGTLRQLDGSYQSWTCIPWLPGKSDWALFRASDGLLVCAQPIDGRQSDDFTAVLPGQYFLVANDDVSLPRRIIVAEGSYLDSPDVSCGLCRIWSVQLDSGMEFPELALRVAGTSVPSLSFEKRRDAVPNIGSYIFAGNPPKIIVSGWTDVTAKNYTVLLDSGSGPICLDEKIIDEVIQASLSIPCKARIWVEPRGRTRHGTELLSSLEFAVLRTPITWQIPREPFDVSEEVPIRLETEEDVSIVWKSPVTPLFPRCWKIKAGVRVAEGSLLAGDLRLPFSMRIPRTGVFALGMPSECPVLWADVIDNPAILRVEALPGEPATLLLRDESATWTLWDLGKMPASGFVECSKTVFRDYLLDAKFAAATIGIRSRGRVNWSSIWIASAQMIRSLLPNPPSNWAAYQLPLVGSVLQTLCSLENGRIDKLELDQRVFQTPLAQCIADCIITAQELEHTTILCSTNPKLHASPKLVSMLALISAQTSEVERPVEVTEPPKFDLIPINRLRQRCEYMWERSTWNATLPMIVAEWRNEVANAIGSAPSRITKLPGGKQLTHAARQYAQVVPNGSPAQFNALIGRLSRSCDEETDDLCRALKLAFNQLALYHSGRHGDAAEIRLDDVPAPLLRLRAQMQDLARFCSRSKLTKQWPAGVGFSHISPVETDASLEEYLLKQ